MTDTGMDADASAVARPDSLMTLYGEQVRVGTEWVAAGRVRVCRRIVTETRMVEVTLRREELVVETDAALAPNGAMAGVVLDGAAVAAPTGPVGPFVVVLREERPEVTTRAHPYERVTVHVDLTEVQQQIDGQVRREVVDLSVKPLT